MWPDSVSLEDDAFQNKGYELTESGLPAYLYEMEGALVRDIITPDTVQHGLKRELHIQFEEPLNQMYCLLAEGSQIEKLPDGSYAVDNKSYYLQPYEMGTGKPMIKTVGNQQQLILPLLASESPLKINYGIIW